MTEKLDTIEKVLNSIQKNLKVPKDKKNLFGNFLYRNAEGILEAYKAEVSKELYPSDLTLVHTFELQLFGTRVFALCSSCLEMTRHPSSRPELLQRARIVATGFAEVDVSKKGMDQAQLSGAVMSYAKKYALCNLFAIDDSKDDPDSEEKYIGEKKTNPFANPKVMSGLAKAADEDMKDTQRKKNEEQFDSIKLAIINLGSLDELAAAWEEKKKELNSLAKYAPDLFAEITASKDREKSRISND
jgi:hypothetical protein